MNVQKLTMKETEKNTFTINVRYNSHFGIEDKYC